MSQDFFCSCTGHEAGEEDVQVYQEGSHSGHSVYISKHDPQGTAGAFDQTPLVAPYPPLEELQQKRLAARRHKTTFAYDFPNVFGNALRKVWVDRDASGEYDGPLPGMHYAQISDSLCCTVSREAILFSAAYRPRMLNNYYHRSCSMQKFEKNAPLSWRKLY